jgi:hypothetical protein
MKSPFFIDTSKESIALVTYTHTNCEDVWPMYFGQIEHHLHGVRSVAFSNDPPDGFDKHTWLKYEESEPYYKQYLSCLEHVEEDFIIYGQEDFFLYDDVTIESLQKYAKFLKNSTYSFARLIRAGYQTPLNKRAGDDLYEVDVNSPDAFSMQATLWKKSDIQKLYQHVKSEKWLEAPHWNDGCRETNTRGVFVYNGEGRRGKFHYDSSIYPYVCTGIIKGLWNTNEYPHIMRDLLEKYKIDSGERGERETYGQTRGMIHAPNRST